MDGEICPSATPKGNPHNQKSLSTLSDPKFFRYTCQFPALLSASVSA